MNNNEKSKVSTRGYHTTNGAAEKASAFAWDFLDDMLKISITPELPESEQSETRRYDYKNSWITCITRLKCLDLYNNIKEVVLPAAKEKTETFVSVPVAEVNQFGFGIRFDEKGSHPYVKLIRNIDPSSLTSSTEIEYEFRKGEVIINYNNETGKFDERVLGDTEMYLFINDLEEFIKASSKAYNHADRVVDKTYKDLVLNSVRAIGNKVGADIPSYNSAQRAGARYGGASLFDSNASQAPSSTITSLNEIGIDDDLPF